MTRIITVPILLTSLLLCGQAHGQIASKSPHGEMDTRFKCMDCHSNTAWAPLDPNRSFDHQKNTDFTLVGRHVQTACVTCHIELHFERIAIAEDNCASCHVDVHQGNLAQSCSTCHNAWSFQDVDGLIVHQSTRFPLTGAHLQLACENCHQDDLGGAFAGLDAECASCHEPPTAQLLSFDHSSLDPMADCQQCHGTNTFAGASFDHAIASNGFDLVGAHAPLVCESCHTGPNNATIFHPSDQDDCQACHAADYATAHEATGFLTGQLCADCHSNTTWETEAFDHALASNGFELVGAHAPLACESCHTGPNNATIFDPADQNDCQTCHAADYASGHEATGFLTGELCAECHSNNAWTPATFDHALASNGFELVGAHAPLACESCHTGQNNATIFDPVDQNDCQTCHAADYATGHEATGFLTGSLCAECHSNNAWTPATFDHALASNGFELVGAHAPLACESCHTGPDNATIFDPTDQNDCQTCHAADYATGHEATGFLTGQLCAECHSNDAWTPATFDHVLASNGFELVGAHAPLACESCHTGPDNATIFDPTDQNDCQACHAADYTSGHEANGFLTGSMCADCHTNTAWTPATFDHVVASNGFELVGAHAPLACESCHTIPDYGTIFDPTDQNDCEACHAADYASGHEANGFLTGSMCADCHTNTAWTPATFDHVVASNGFELVGAHAPLSCESCHVMPGYELLFNPSDQNDCVTCHETDYQTSHVAAGLDLGTDCATCHSNDTWNGAEFDHDSEYFPIYSGAHNNRWDNCQTCHEQPGDYSVFTCLTCHAHRKSAMDSRHQGRRNYSYESTACLDCHPRGRG